VPVLNPVGGEPNEVVGCCREVEHERDGEEGYGDRQCADVVCHGFRSGMGGSLAVNLEDIFADITGILSTDIEIYGTPTNNLFS